MTAEQMAEIQWLKPKRVAPVRFTEWTATATSVTPIISDFALTIANGCSSGNACMMGQIANIIRTPAEPLCNLNFEI